MKSFRKLALISTIATYVLIFVGGLVRVSGAGLGCPDWPKCFGRWIPPTDISQLPAGMDPSLFNFTLAWIEYINRLTGMIVGLLIAATGIMAIIKMRKYPKILYPSILAALLVAFQGWQGSRVVSSALEPFIITVHLVLALLIVSLMIFVTQQAYYSENNSAPVQREFKKYKMWAGILWFVTLSQIILGTQIRAVIKEISDNYPLLPTAEWIDMIGPIVNVHTVFGILITGLSIMLVTRLYNDKPVFHGPVKLISVTLIVLVGLQMVVGIGFKAAGIEPVLQVTHLWISSLMIGGELILYTMFNFAENRK
ncbi:MAG: heme A synthase [Calditrichaceae bacterium]